MWTDICRGLSACLDLFLPPACLLCGRSLPAAYGPLHLCGDCLASVPALGPAHCPLCARPMPSATSCHLCGTCLQRPPVFTDVHVVGLYQGGIKDAVHRLKYRNQLVLAKPLGQLLCATVASGKGDFRPHRVVPVPLHPRRLKERGFNQAVEVARPLALHLQIPLDVRLLQRVRQTPPQQGLSAADRGRNLRNAFALAARATDLNILLVDDVMTTGETVRECCRTLLAGGVKEVQVAVVGRA